MSTRRRRPSKRGTGKGHAAKSASAKQRPARPPRTRTGKARGAVTATVRGPRETPDARAERARTILALLAQAYPDARIALDFSTPLELLVATILSAQCTDERVNMVTPVLFRTYCDAEAYAQADLAALEREIHSTGFYRAKAKSIKAMAQALVERHRGRIPRTREELVHLPGVGLKTANVVLGNAFGQSALAVDTHVFRVSQRLGLARAAEPDEVHDQLVAVLPAADLTQATHLLIVHGRRTCTARQPACPACPVRDLCPWPAKTRG